MNWWRKHRVGIALTILSVVAVIGMFSFSGEKVVPFLQGTSAEPILLVLGWPNSIAFNLCVGYLTSVFFWWLVVFLPDNRRRSLLRTNLAGRYEDFKRNTIQICVWAAGLSLTSDEIDGLLDKNSFKEFFKGQRWYDVANGLQGNAEYLQGVLLEMDMLAQEVGYSLNNVAVHDAGTHGVFKRLVEQVYRMRYDSNYTADPAKYVSQFLWAVHTNWSFAVGQMPNDPIAEQIKEL